MNAGSVHHWAQKLNGVCERIKVCGAQPIYLPPFSPNLSPTEACWSKLKALLRATQARTREALDAAIGRPWPRSHRRMHAAGSGIVTMPYNKLKPALD